jgi:hypothetical protein
VWGARDAEGWGRGRERPACRSRSPSREPPTQVACRWSRPLTLADLRWPGRPVAHVGQAREHSAQTIEQSQQGQDFRLGGRLSTRTPSRAAAASHVSPRAQRKRQSRSAPWRQRTQRPERKGFGSDASRTLASLGGVRKRPCAGHWKSVSVTPSGRETTKRCGHPRWGQRMRFSGQGSRAANRGQRRWQEYGGRTDRDAPIRKQRQPRRWAQ